MYCDNSKEFHCRNEWLDFGDGVTCLANDKVCDGTADCPYSDDELPYPDNYNQDPSNSVSHDGDMCATACSDINLLKSKGEWDCDGDCIPTPDGPVCACPSGLYWDNSVFKCHDVDECILHNRCDQRCTNFVGTFECSCIDGYIKEETGACRASTDTVVVLQFTDQLQWTTANTSDIVSKANDTPHKTLVVDRSDEKYIAKNLSWVIQGHCPSMERQQQ